MEFGSKEIMAKNILYYMEKKGKTRKDVCKDLGFKYSTFVDWCAGNKYPRIDKIEIMADYFGVAKSDLIEDKPHDATYYSRQETAEIADTIYHNKYMGMVFDAMRDSSPEEIKDFYDMMMLMKRRERREE